MKYFIFFTLILSLGYTVHLGYRMYFHHPHKKNKNVKIPEHLTEKFWRQATPEKLKEKLKNIKDVNEVRPDDRKSMLHLLVKYGKYPEMVSILIDAGVDYSLMDNDGDGDRIKALHGAALIPHKNNYIHAHKFIKEILKYDKKIDEVGFLDHGEVTPLLIAAYGKTNADIIKLFLEKGANPNFRGDKGHTPLILALMPIEDMPIENDVHTEPRPEVIQLLLHYGADMKIKNIEGKTAYDYMKENKGFTKTDLFKKLSIQFNDMPGVF